MKYHIRILAGFVDRAAGSHLYHQMLAQKLAERGHHVSLLCFESTPEVRRYAEVHSLAREPFHEAKFIWRLAPLLQHQQFNRSIRGLGLSPADVVIGGEHLFLKGHRRLFPRTPWIYLPHSLTVSQEILGEGLARSARIVADHFYRHLQRWALNHADRTLRFTRLACEALRREYGSSVRPRFVVNPMGIEIPGPRHEKPRGGPVRLLWVGQLIPGKRIDVAIRALATLKHLDWRFDVVGDSPMRGDLEAQVGHEGLSDRVRFHGFQTDPTDFYADADLLLFPSRSENSPVTMLEAMSHGVPCLAMRADGVNFHNANAELIDPDVDGFLADSDETFRTRLGELLTHHERLRPAGDAARRRMVDRHRWDDHIGRYEVLFEELSAAAGSSDSRRLSGRPRKTAETLGG